MGVIDSSSCRLRCEPKVVTSGVGDFSLRPSRPDLLIVLTFRVMPEGSCPSCCCCRLFLHKKKKMPPTIASRPTTPPATPPAMAPTLDFSSGSSVAAAGDVGDMTTVRVMTLPLSVTTVGIVTGCSVTEGESSVSDVLVDEGSSFSLSLVLYRIG